MWARPCGRRPTESITFAARKGPNGNLITIRHQGGYTSAYAHLSRFEHGIHVGVHVRQRQTIGYVGTTGRSTGPHLHFGLKHDGRFVDPLSVLDGPGRMLPAGLLPRYRREERHLSTELDAIPLPAHPASGGGSAPPPAPSDQPMD